MHPKLMHAPTGPITGRSCRCMSTCAGHLRRGLIICCQSRNFLTWLNSNKPLLSPRKRSLPVIQHQEMICGRGMSSDAGGRPEVKRKTRHPPAVCSRVWPRRQEKNDDRQLTNGMMERAADATKKNGVGDGWASQRHELSD